MIVYTTIRLWRRPVIKKIDWRNKIPDSEVLIRAKAPSVNTVTEGPSEMGRSCLLGCLINASQTVDVWPT
uniref:Uncharacterized protein n=1 Tax=Arion vulgaris TaxID=1028688 RepID=A0A0B6Z0N5_9EUPU